MPKPILIDGKGHLLGRLASVCAKQLLNGQPIMVVRCEDLIISGSLFRNKLKFLDFLRKRSNSNPRKHSHIHYRSPAKIFWRTVRGMLPHKKKRGAMALADLKTFEGIPEQFETKRRVVCNAALKAIRLRPHSDCCRLGDMSSRVGWNNDPIVAKLEARRIERSSKHWALKKAHMEKVSEARVKAVESLSTEDRELLASVGRN
eukprot:GHVO01004023.1.p1 GENE.GHVO01004023.1~~GHVO01004023.1.p1  ORF type:complete len:217 (+),score=27.97 GHVO01004023.1:44-652(+)